MPVLHTAFAQEMLDFLIVTFQDSEITLHTVFHTPLLSLSNHLISNAHNIYNQKFDVFTFT